MRITMDEGDLEAHGGQEVVTFQVARALAERGHGIDLIYHGPGSLAPGYRRFCRSMRRLPGIPPDRHRPLASAFGSAALAAGGLLGRPDAVYVNQAAGAAHGAVIAGAHRVPLVCHLHLPPVPWTPPLRWALGRVTRFVAVSEALRRRYVEAGFDHGSIEVVHNGVDTSRFTDGDGGEVRRRLGIPPGAFVALYAGRLDPPKGVDVLVEAWRRLGLGPLEGRLVVAGEPRGGGRPVEILAHAAALRAALPPPAGTWLPRQEDVVGLYRAADVVVLPSLWEEPFGLVLLEAMACGRPVVASAAGGIPEILGGRLSRFLVAPGDPAALAQRLASLVGWRSREPGLGAEVRRRVEERFSLDAMAAGVEAVLEGAVETAVPAAGRGPRGRGRPVRGRPVRRRVGRGRAVRRPAPRRGEAA